MSSLGKILSGMDVFDWSGSHVMAPVLADGELVEGSKHAGRQGGKGDRIIVATYILPSYASKECLPFIHRRSSVRGVPQSMTPPFGLVLHRRTLRWNTEFHE